MNLLETMTDFYEVHKSKTKYLPLTYNIKIEWENQKSHLLKIKSIFSKIKSQNAESEMWVLKPGKNSNRGKNITIFKNIMDVQDFILEQEPGDQNWVVQKYIENPLLIGGPNWYNTPRRKFDIRVFGLAQIVKGTHLRGYVYQEGYIRTSSFEYSTSIKEIDNKFIHLTNDAIQDKSSKYGKYESGNKISQRDFQQFLKNEK